MKATAMRLLPPALLLLALTASTLATAQTSAAPAPPAATQPPPTPSVSSILNPSISTLQQTLGSLRLDKWKTNSATSQETESNISSIYRDLENTLPSLLTTADQAPDSISSVLPAYRNVEALYDVLLRIVQVARLSAPPQQSAALDQALSSLESGRRALGDTLQSSALTQEKRVRDMQEALRTPPPAPVVAACPPPPAPPAKKRTTRPKPAPAPANSQSSTPR